MKTPANHSTGDGLPDVVVENLRGSDLHGEYIGRPFPKRGLRGSPLGNPFRIEEGTDREGAIASYEIWIAARMAERDPSVVAELERLAALARLRRLRLFCWCKPQPCHGDVVARIVREMVTTANK